LPKTLIVFDMDGVLVEPRSSWSIVHQALGTKEHAQLYARLYWEGRISYMDWMLADTTLWLESEPGLTKHRLLEILGDAAEPRGEAYDAVALLRSRGFEVAIISGGLDLVAERVAGKLGIRLWVSPRLLFDKEGRLLPGGVPLVEADAKHRWLLRFMRETGAARACVAGDTRLDAPMMRLAGCGVAVNPLDNVVVRAAGGRIARDPLEAAEIMLGVLSG